jgi:hypothetical protein
MLPSIKQFMAAHDLPDVTIAAEAGTAGEANQKQIEAAGCRSSSAPGSRTSRACPDGGRRDRASYYQYRLTGPGRPSRSLERDRQLLA